MALGVRLFDGGLFFAALRRRAPRAKRAGVGYLFICAFLLYDSAFWRWPNEGRQGNTIDLLVNVLGMSFDQAMRRIAPCE
jgi:hypothetical protein